MRSATMRAVSLAIQLLAIGVLVCGSRASAQCVPSFCTIAITLQSDSGGVTLGGSGTSSATLGFGTMQAFGGVTPTGVTKTAGGSSWTISTPFDVKVTCTVVLTLLPCGTNVSPSYTLTVQLQSSDATDTWKVGGSTVTSASATTLTASGTYAQTVVYSFALTIPFTASAGAINNHVNLVATAN